jgi:hypothetical protein
VLGEPDGMVKGLLVDEAGIQAAFDEVFDQAVMFHGFADYMRDYEVFVHATADPRTGIPPQHLRYRFKYYVHAAATSALSPQVWGKSLDEGCELEGYVWGVKWQNLYPGMRLVSESAEAGRWSRSLEIPFYEAAIETNGHNLSLVFADLVVDVIAAGMRRSSCRRTDQTPRFLCP